MERIFDLDYVVNSVINNIKSGLNNRLFTTTYFFDEMLKNAKRFF